MIFYKKSCLKAYLVLNPGLNLINPQFLFRLFKAFSRIIFSAFYEHPIINPVDRKN